MAQTKLVFTDAEKILAKMDEDVAAYNKTLYSQPERAIEARKLAKAYIGYEDVDELAAHIEIVLSLWEFKGACRARDEGRATDREREGH